MIVYHGTTISRAKEIIKKQAISVTTKENRRNNSSNTGKVYVTSQFFQAIDFSTRPEMGKKEYSIVVFEIEIDPYELKPDLDEEKWKSTLDPNGEKHCYVINRDLSICSDVKRLYYKPFNDYKAADKLMQDIQYGIVSVQDEDWTDLFKDNREESLKIFETI